MPPSRTRFGVILFAIALGVITYIDRVCISKVKEPLCNALGLSTEQWGWALGAFTLAYALFEIPGGWMGDRWGPRVVLMRVVSFWSVFTALTGMVTNFWNLVLCRFLFGAGEAGAFPNITKMYTLWLPQTERSIAQGITWMCARLGGAFTPLLVVAVIDWLGWRHMFLAFGGLGVLWVVLFTLWFRDRPSEHPGVNEGERALLAPNESNVDSHASIPWAAMFQSRSVTLLWIYYACISYAWYFYVTWLPTYLAEGLKVEGVKSAMLNSLPLLLGGLGCFLGGIVAAKLARSIGMFTARRGIALCGMIGAGICLAWSIYQRDPTLIMITMGLSGFFNDLSMPCAWGACMDVGGKHAGAVSGSMNMMGNLGGFVGSVAPGYLLKWSGDNWSVPLWVAAGTYVISALCWVFIDPVTPLKTKA